jgi:hypothetical protein
MESSTLKKAFVVIGLGVVGWGLCGAIMFIGMEVTSEQTTLILHAIGAPIIFAAISWLYFTRFNFTSPLATASIFLLIVIALDFFIVSLLIIKSFENFESILGSWIPFALIFLSTYLTGLRIEAGVAKRRTV